LDFLFGDANTNYDTRIPELMEKGYFGRTFTVQF
jgi:hypothetical protein